MFSRMMNAASWKQAAVGVASIAGAGFSVANCSDDHIPALDYGWSHHGALKSFDYAAIRRGFQVLSIQKFAVYFCIF